MSFIGVRGRIMFGANGDPIVAIKLDQIWSEIIYRDLVCDFMYCFIYCYRTKQSVLSLNVVFGTCVLLYLVLTDPFVWRLVGL